tara:strand:- start:1700 stop:4930 length:3231 start_codon:yes stop_codon:yes gene_type:complete
MLYKSQNIISDIQFALSLITTDVKYGSHLNFNDKAKASEKIFSKILSVLFDKQFSECDLKIHNYPAIDLSSENIAFQVSAQDTPTKIKETISSFKKHIDKGSYQENYTNIKFLIISHKNKFNKGTFSETDTYGLFNPDEDILFSTKLGKEIIKLSDDKQQDLRDYLWYELNLESNIYDNRFNLIKSLPEYLHNPNNEIKARTTQIDFDQNLLYYSQKDEEEILSFSNSINFEHNLPYLITGHPTTGKTTTAIHICNTIQSSVGVVPFYYQAKNDNEYASILSDLKSINGLPSVLIIDDIHLNFDLANRLIRENSKFKNIIFLFVSRHISSDFRKDFELDDIFEELKNSCLSLENNRSKDFQRDKILGIVKKRSDYLLRNNYNPRQGGVLHLEHISKNNLLKLKLLLNLWCKEDDVLSNINDELIHNELFSKFLRKYPKEEILEIIKYSCLYSFNIQFEKLDPLNPLTTEREGLFYTKDVELKSLFMQASFCDLLIDSYLFIKHRAFSVEYNSDKNLFKFKNIKQYIEEIKIEEYPDIIIDIFLNVGSAENYDILRLLFSDDKSKKALFQYFATSDKANSSQLKKIIQISKIYAKAHLNEIINGLIINNKNINKILLREDIGLFVLSYVHYSISPIDKLLKSKLYETFSDENIRQLISACANHKITLAIQNINDNKIRNRITNLIPQNKWQVIINETPFDLIGNSLTELRKLKFNNAKEIFDSLDPIKLAESIKWISFPNFTKTLSELKTFEKKIKNSKAKIILNSVEEWKFKKSIEKATIQQIGQGFAQLKKIDDNYLQKILVDYPSEILFDKLSEIKFLDDYSLILINIFNANTSLARSIGELIEQKHSFKERFNSSGIKGREIPSILNCLSKIGATTYSSKLIEDSNKDIIEGRVLSSAPEISVRIINSIKPVNEPLATKLLSKFLDLDLSTKFDNKNYKLSQMTDFLINFAQCNENQCYQFFEEINNKIFISKSLKYDVSFVDICTFLSNVKNCNIEKTRDIYSNIYAHNVFHKKAREVDPRVFVNSLHQLNSVDDKFTIKFINSYVNQKNISKDLILNIIKELKKDFGIELN